MEGFFGPALESLPADLGRFLTWFYGHERLSDYNVEDVGHIPGHTPGGAA